MSGGGGWIAAEGYSGWNSWGVGGGAGQELGGYWVSWIGSGRGPGQALALTTSHSPGQAYERGIALFRWPNVADIWHTYLTKFIARYGGTKLERARDLFEQALDGCPQKYAKST